MNQRLVWNFEFTPKTTTFPAEILVKKKSEQIKWEIRFFWPDDKAIVMNTIDNSLLDLANYHQKHREDYYYLLPGSNYNIKRRHHELLYKPLLKQSDQALGFDAKINIDSLGVDGKKTNPHAPIVQEIVQRMAHEEGVDVYVRKEAFIYKFPTRPTIKLELARLEVHNQVYLSACIEGKARELVENIAERLLGKHVSCEYVTFLKNILHI
jgi:hypothetical protein